jgi:hypothetical protein
VSAFFVITAGDVIAGVVIALLVVAALAIKARDAIKQAACKHAKGVRETSACDAICKACGKNLGFIGNVKHGKDQP